MGDPVVGVLAWRRKHFSMKCWFQNNHIYYVRFSLRHVKLGMDDRWWSMCEFYPITGTQTWIGHVSQVSRGLKQHEWQPCRQTLPIVKGYGVPGVMRVLCDPHSVHWHGDRHRPQARKRQWKGETGEMCRQQTAEMNLSEWHWHVLLRSYLHISPTIVSKETGCNKELAGPLRTSLVG